MHVSLMLRIGIASLITTLAGCYCGQKPGDLGPGEATRGVSEVPWEELGQQAQIVFAQDKSIADSAKRLFERPSRDAIRNFLEVAYGEDVAARARQIPDWLAFSLYCAADGYDKIKRWVPPMAKDPIDRLPRLDAAISFTTPFLHSMSPEIVVAAIHELSSSPTIYERLGVTVRQQLRDHLNNPNAAIREEAVRAVAAFLCGPKTRTMDEGLWRLTEDPEPRVRTAAYRSVVAFDARAKGAELAAGLPKERDPLVRAAIVGAIASLVHGHSESGYNIFDGRYTEIVGRSPEFRPVLESALDDPDPGVRLAALRGIGCQPLSTQLLSKVAGFLKEPDPIARRVAVGLLGHCVLDRDAGLKQILPCLDDPDKDVRNDVLEVFASAAGLRLDPDKPASFEEVKAWWKMKNEKK